MSRVASSQKILCDPNSASQNDQRDVVIILKLVCCRPPRGLWNTLTRWEGGGGAQRLNKYAGWYFQAYVSVRLLRRESSTGG